MSKITFNFLLLINQVGRHSFYPNTIFSMTTINKIKVENTNLNCYKINDNR